MERSFGGELDEICGGLSAAAGFRITSNAKPPAFVLGLSANKSSPIENTVYTLSTHEEYKRIQKDPTPSIRLLSRTLNCPMAFLFSFLINLLVQFVQ